MDNKIKLRKLWCMLDNLFGFVDSECEEHIDTAEVIDKERTIIAQNISDVYDEQGYDEFVKVEIEPYIVWLPKEGNWLIT